MALVKRIFPTSKEDRSVFFTSDTHFGHRNIIQYTNRPFDSVEEMDEALISNWNKVVKPDDIVYHLGDVCVGSKSAGIDKLEYCKQIVSRLNGRKRLVLGNHDDVHRMYQYLDAGFERVYDKPVVIDDFFILTHEPLEFVPAGWVNLYGHVHADTRFRTFSDVGCCVCVERHGYQPVSMKDIKKFLNCKDIK